MKILINFVYVEVVVWVVLYVNENFGIFIGSSNGKLWNVCKFWVIKL